MTPRLDPLSSQYRQALQAHMEALRNHPVAASHQAADSLYYAMREVDTAFRAERRKVMRKR